MQQLPRPGDLITLHDLPGKYHIVACLGQFCGLLSPSFPRGASQQIQIHEIATINGNPASFAAPSEPPKKRRAALSRQ